MARLLLVVAAALGCSNQVSPETGDQPGPARVDAGRPADAAEPEPSPVVRFVAMGDVGKGNEGQYQVADAIEAKCAMDGCDFVVLLGDNFYNLGISSVDDPQWQEKFELPYANIDLPFYAVLGNHDYNQNGIASSWGQGPVEVQYSDVSDKWVMPDTHYTFTAGPVGFIMLDTNSIFWDSTVNGDQEAWYPQALSEVEGAEWVFVAGHHPYLSNGSHGNAGDYDNQVIGGIEIPNPIVPVNGKHVKAFFDDYVCGSADVYLAGHDHNRQWLNEPDALCGTEMIVSGAGASISEQDAPRNGVHFEEYESEGFFYIVVEGNRLTGQFIDKHGVQNYERTITR